MAVIVEDGSRPAGANSYVDPAGAEATAYFTGHLYAATWTNASVANREAAVIMATRTLDATFEWNGQCVAQDQPLGWPRTGVTWRGTALPTTMVPKPVRDATLEQALAMLTRDRTSDTANAAPVEALNLGDGALQLNFGSDPAVTVPPVPDYIAGMLRDLGSRVGGSKGGMSKISRR
jgi:hypothetical protein